MSFAGEENIAYLTKKGFFDKPQKTVSYSNPYEKIRKSLYQHSRYANLYNLNSLKDLYAENYVNADGLNKNIYFDLIKKTWASYPDVKYKIDIKSIDINSNTASVIVSESASATTNTKSGVVNEKGLLLSYSTSIYYFEKINNQWLITSDNILSEKTYLLYGSAKKIKVDLDAPMQVQGGSSYTATLKLDVPKDSLVIASIGKENITYPQTTAEEVFRKVPEDGILERVFTANEKNMNEYAVASYGVTKAEIKNGVDIKIYVTGLGFVMTRVNNVAKNEFIRVVDNEKKD